MTKLTINPAHIDLVPNEFPAFVEAINLEKYEALHPNAGRVVIKKYEDQPGDNKTDSGFILTGEKEDYHCLGVVVARGDDPLNLHLGERVDLGFEVGDVVYYREHFGHMFTFGNDREQLLSMNYDDLIGRLRRG